MWRVLARVVTGLQMVVFAWGCLVASPVVLFSFGVDAVRHGIEARWPENERARAVSFWLGLLAPVVFLAAVTVLLVTFGTFVASRGDPAGRLDR